MTRVLSIVGVVLWACSAFGQEFGAPILPPSGTFSSPANLPPVGLASSETAQVNVVNTAVAPTASATTPSCTGSIAFYNAKGAIIGTATTFNIGSGQIFSATLPYSALGASGARTEIRAAITTQVTIAPRAPIAPCALAFSFETFDAVSGVTHVFFSGTGNGILSGILTPAF